MSKGHRGFMSSKENVTIKQLGEKVANLIPNTKLITLKFFKMRNYKVDTNH